ncbi:RmlC-like cupin domain-containing protein, partial [Bisporella sp. PMI_857]
PPSSTGLTLFQQLTLAPNAVSRLALLKDEDFVFKFDNPLQKTGVASGEGGSIVRADHATFPALVSQGGALAIGFLGPCGFNTPHVHPRAAELNLVIEGHLFANVVAENGARFMNHTLSKYEMTVFPQGAVHTEFNPDCTPSVFVAAFPHEDPGVGQIAQEYFGLENEIVKGSAGGEVSIDGADIEKFRAKIPANVAKGVDSCLQRCG